jgi:hypothetical protein
MKYFIGIIFIIISCLFLECKKSSTTSSSSGGSPPPPVGTGNPSGTYYGFMMTTNVQIVPSAFTSSGTAAFFISPVSMGGKITMVGTTTITTGSVGSLSLTYSGSPTYYPLGTPIFPPATWNITGAGSIPSFTYTNSDASPLGPTGFGFDTLSLIHRNQPLLISLVGISGADQAIVTVTDSANKQISVFISATSLSITVPKDSLSKLNRCSSATISLILIKYNSQTLGGKPFLFASASQEINSNISLQ